MRVVSWEAVNRKLTLEARKFLKEAYGFELAIPVKVNGRMKSTFGVFKHARGRKESVCIELGKNYILHNEWKTIYETLIHECIHYWCFEMDRPYRDGDAFFENELRKHGSHSTGTVSYKGKVVQYACTADGCSKIYQKKKRYPRDGAGYRSGCCRAPIKNIGFKMV